MSESPNKVKSCLNEGQVRELVALSDELLDLLEADLAKWEEEKDRPNCYPTIPPDDCIAFCKEAIRVVSNVKERAQGAPEQVSVYQVGILRAYLRAKKEGEA